MVLMLIAVVGLGIAAIYYVNNREQPKAVSTNANTTDTGTFTLSPNAQEIEETILRGEALHHEQLIGLTPPELRILRNVHFAKYGRTYERPGLGDYFYTRQWYRQSDSYSDAALTSVDKENVRVILAKEKEAAPSNGESNIGANHLGESSQENRVSSESGISQLNEAMIQSFILKMDEAAKAKNVFQVCSYLSAGIRVNTLVNQEGNVRDYSFNRGQYCDYLETAFRTMSDQSSTPTKKEITIHPDGLTATVRIDADERGTVGSQSYYGTSSNVIKLAIEDGDIVVAAITGKSVVYRR